MATCPHCQEEYSPPSAKFCNRCGESVGEVAAAQPDVVAAESVGSGVPDASQPVATAEAPGGGDTTTRIVSTGEGNLSAGGDITYNTSIQEKWCAVGHEQLFEDRQLFRCAQCHRNPVCELHFDASQGMCNNCAGGQASKAAEMSQLLGEDDIVILGGEVVPRSTVTLVNGQLVAEDGRRAGGPEISDLLRQAQTVVQGETQTLAAGAAGHATAAPPHADGLDRTGGLLLGRCS